MRKMKSMIAILLLTAMVLCGCGDTELVSIEKAKINKKGELVLTYTDGSEDNLGVVVGKDGADGEDGTDGSDGEDGASGSVMGAVATALRSSVSIFCTFSGSDGESYSGGSGVIYWLDKKAGDALIITNYHVVYENDVKDNNGISQDISVYLYGGELEGRDMEATYVGGSMYYDIAILQVQDSQVLRESDVQVVTVADSDAIVPGQTAIAVGNAEGEGIAATTGIISVDSEHIDMTASDDKTEISVRVMRIDTAVNHGNSGGGLFNDQGQLIGIVNAKIIEDDVENIGYAIPSRVATAVADNIIDYCLDSDNQSVMRPLLGITIINSHTKGVYDKKTGLMHIEETIKIDSVDQTSLVYGQLEAEDVFVSIALNGKTYQVTRQHHLIDLMLTARVGDQVTFTVLRDEKTVTVTVELPESCLTEY